MTTSNEFAPLIEAATEIPAILHGTAAEAAEVVAALEALHAEIAAEQERLAGQLESARVGLEGLAELCIMTDARVAEVLEQALQGVGAFEMALTEARTVFEHTAGETHAAVGALMARLAEVDAIQEHVAGEAIVALGECSAIVNASADSTATLLGTAQTWLVEAQEAVEQFSQHLDMSVDRVYADSQTVEGQLGAKWEEVRDGVESSQQAFATALTSLSNEQLERVVTELRNRLEAELQNNVQTVIEAAVGELRQAVEVVIRGFGENESVLSDARSVVESFVVDLDRMLDELKEAAQNVFDLGARLGVS